MRPPTARKIPAQIIIVTAPKSYTPLVPGDCGSSTVKPPTMINISPAIVGKIPSDIRMRTNIGCSDFPLFNLDWTWGKAER
jgi:hypothetical protein